MSKYIQSKLLDVSGMFVLGMSVSPARSQSGQRLVARCDICGSPTANGLSASARTTTVEARFTLEA